MSATEQKFNPATVSPPRQTIRPVLRFCALAGLIEVRGLGIRRLAHEPVAVVGLVVDLAADDANRLPESSETVICGMTLPRLAVAGSADPLFAVLATLRFPAGDIKPPS